MPEVRAEHCADADYGRALRTGLLSAARRRGRQLRHRLLRPRLPRRRGRASLRARRSGDRRRLEARRGRHRRPRARCASSRPRCSARCCASGSACTSPTRTASRRCAATRSSRSPRACHSGQDLFDTELILRVERAGLRTAEIPVGVTELRPARTSIVKRVPRTLLGLVKLRIVLVQGPPRVTALVARADPQRRRRYLGLSGLARDGRRPHRRDRHRRRRPTDAIDLGDALLAPGIRRHPGERRRRGRLRRAPRSTRSSRPIDAPGRGWLHRVPADDLQRAARRRTRRCSSACAAVRAARPDAVLGVHLEGPFLGGAPGAHPRELVRPVDLDWLAQLCDRFGDLVRLVTLAPEADPGLAAIALLHERGVVVALGHSTVDYDGARAAADAGARVVTHLFNGMGPLHHRAPGLGRRRARRPPARSVDHRRRRARAPGAAAARAPRAARRGAGDRRGRDGRAGRCARDGAAYLADGTLAGSTLTMVDRRAASGRARLRARRPRYARATGNAATCDRRDRPRADRARARAPMCSRSIPDSARGVGRSGSARSRRGRRPSSVAAHGNRRRAVRRRHRLPSGRGAVDPDRHHRRLLLDRGRVVPGPAGAAPRRAGSRAATDPTATPRSRRCSAAAGEEIGRNRQTFFVEPGKFGYRLVKGELEFPEPGTIEACCTIVERRHRSQFRSPRCRSRESPSTRG